MTVRRAAVAALAAGLLLAGCAGDPEPRFAEPSDPASSPTESASSEEPERQSPEEFIREWFRLNTEMQNTGDSEAFLATTHRCPPCTRLARRVDRIYEDGGYVRIKSQHVAKIDPGARSASIRQFDVTVESAPTVYQESAESDPARYEGGTVVFQLTLMRGAGAWHVHDFIEVR